MQKIVVKFPEARTVYSSLIPVGSTNADLIVEDGTHVFTLSEPQDYDPPEQKVIVAGTSAFRPMIITFTRISAVVARWFPAPLADFTTIAPRVDAMIAHLSPLALNWQIERETPEKIRAVAVLESEATSGDTWSLVILEKAGLGLHRHNAGGDYGEMVVSLAGELKDISALGHPLKLGASTVAFHGASTRHAPSADVFWLGLFHQPRGITLL